MIPLDPHLLAALLDPTNEGDDGLRLVIADFWDERGEGERAEFVKVQVELARLGPPQCEHAEEPRCSYCTGCARRWSLQRRERELLRAPHPNGMTCNEVVWAGEAVRLLPRPGNGYEFHRGFVERVSCRYKDWLARSKALLAAQPVRRVALTTWPAVRWVASDGTYSRVPCSQSALEHRKSVIVDRTLSVVNRMLACLATEWPGVRFVLPLMSEEEARILHGDPNADLPLGVIHMRDRHRHS